MCPELHDPDLPLVVLFEHWPGTVRVFFSHRMLWRSIPMPRAVAAKTWIEDID